MPGLNLPLPPAEFIDMHERGLPDFSLSSTSIESITGKSGATCPLNNPIVDSLLGASTYYDPIYYYPNGVKTLHPTASGLPYGSGVAIAPHLMSAYPLRSSIRVTNKLNGVSIQTIVADTGNFGMDTANPIVNIYDKNYTRLIDCPINIKQQLGFGGSTVVEIEKV